jgi:hypothetical protein
MDELSALQGLGLQMPTPAYLFGAIVFGLIGLAAFRLGRRSERPATLWLGVALMAYPYAVSRTWMLYAAGIAMCVGIYVDHVRSGE